MEIKKLNFSIEPGNASVVVRLPRLSIEPLKAKTSLAAKRTAMLADSAFVLLQKAIAVSQDRLSTFFSEMYEAAQRLNTRQKISLAFSGLKKRIPRRRPSKKLFRSITALVVLALVIVGLNKLIQTARNGIQNDQRVEIEGAIASVALNREFSFPLRDGSGEEVSQIKFTIENAELRNEIIVKGQRASSVKGRRFLILNLKIVNEYEQAIEIDSRHYVRLMRNGNQNEKLAADIHNDPVEVQAISTKLTRIGFPINDTDKDLKLLVGEISAEKETVDLPLK